MKYIERKLVGDEKILYQGKIAHWYYWGFLVFSACFFCLTITFFLMGISLWNAGLVLALFALLPTLVNAISAPVITDKRVLSRLVDINLSTIESAQVKQGIIGRTFNYGSVVIEVAGERDSQYITGIKDPLQFRKAVLRLQSEPTCMENVTEPKPGNDKKLWEKCSDVAVFPFFLLIFGGLFYECGMGIIESVVGLSALLLLIFLQVSEKFNNFSRRVAKIKDPLIDILCGICVVLPALLLGFIVCVLLYKGIHYGNSFYEIEPIVPDWIQAKTGEQLQGLFSIAGFIAIDIVALLHIPFGNLKLRRANKSA